MRRFVGAIILFVLICPLATGNVMIIRVVIEGGTTTRPTQPDSAVPGLPPSDAVPEDPTASEGAPSALQEPPPSASPPADNPARSVVVMIPVLGKLDEKRVFDLTKPRHPDFNPEWNTIRHRYGTTFLYTDGVNLTLHPVAQRSRQQMILDRYNAWESKKQGAAELHRIALEALATGMTAEAEAYCDKLLALTKVQSSGLSPELRRFAQAYSELAPKMKSPSSQPAEVDFWMDRLANLSSTGTPPNVQKYMHFALVYWDVQPEEVTRRLQQLENNFKNFYLWHALRGESLKVPDKPLTVILAPHAREVLGLYRALNGRSLTADGFYSAEYDVLVLSPDRLDPVGQAFRRMVDAVYRSRPEANPADLVKGKLSPNSFQLPPEERARLTTLALVDQAYREDQEWYAVSREGSRQLLHAIGALPRYVALPRWLESGYGSLYERPRIPVYSEQEHASWRMTFPVDRGTGVPHYAMLKAYRDFTQAGELDVNPASRLRKVIQDDYFAAIRSGIDVDPKRGRKPSEPEKAVDPSEAKTNLTEKLSRKAQCTAWALVYFLAHERPAELRRLGEELDRLPHDLPLEPAAMQLAFARAFGLLQPDGLTWDSAAVDKLAQSWDSFMNTLHTETLEVTISRPKPMENPMPMPKFPAPMANPSDQ